MPIGNMPLSEEYLKSVSESQFKRQSIYTI